MFIAIAYTVPDAYCLVGVCRQAYEHTMETFQKHDLFSDWLFKRLSIQSFLRKKCGTLVCSKRRNTGCILYLSSRVFHPHSCKERQNDLKLGGYVN